jgi:hypothetical protein
VETIEGRWRGSRRLKELYELSNKKYSSDNYKEMGLGQKAFEEYFSEDVYFNYSCKQLYEIQNNQLIPESIYRSNFTLKSRTNI